MIDERDLLERALRRFEPETGLTERVMRRRERKHRNQRIRAGALGVVVALAVAITASRALLDEPEPQETPPPTSGYQRSIYLWDPTTASSTLLGLGTDRPADAELSPDGQRLVYEAAPSGGLSQIYVLDIGGEVRQLTDLELGAFDPTWSPDGTEIAFAAATGEDPDANDKDIFVMNADGTDLRRLVGTTDDDGHPDWSPDGTRIVFDGLFGEAPRGARIWVASIETLDVSPISPTDRSSGSAHPAWSPDGRWIAHIRFVRYATMNNRILDSDLWLMRADGTGGRVIWDAREQIAQHPTWAPDGDVILFAQGPIGGRAGLGLASFAGRLVAIDTNTGATVTVLDSVVDANTGWSADGIVMVLPYEDDTPPAEPLPPELRVDVGAD